MAEVKTESTGAAAGAGKDYAALTFKKSEVVSFPGVGQSSTIRVADHGVKRITRQGADNFVLVVLDSGREFEVAMGVIGVLERVPRA